jgi:DNA adenine methylase
LTASDREGRLEFVRPNSDERISRGEKRALARPFLKWVGGKRQLLPAIRQHVPTSYRTYHEPFLGGGALFFDLRPSRAVLTDSNVRLIRAYQGVRDDCERVIELLRSYEHKHTKDFYLGLRKVDIDAQSDVEVAAWLIYLNRTGYNGLYRVNRSNQFNVPFGRYENPTICDAGNLRACSRALREADLQIKDFKVVLDQAKRGDFVYFDPPYVPLSTTSSFTAYTQHGFGWDSQIELHDTAKKLKRRGVQVLVSNSASVEVQKLYARGFHHERVEANRAVNSRADRRGKISELLIW